MKDYQFNCFLGVQTRYHSAKSRQRGWEGRTILSLEMRQPNSTGTLFFSSFLFFFSPFLLRMALSDKKYRRKAQLLSAVLFCGFSHTKLWPACRSALCYYDRKKWISNVVPLPAASSLWIFSHPESNEPELRRRASPENITSRWKKKKKNYSLSLWAQHGDVVHKDKGKFTNTHWTERAA